jgi:hypothetical protein
MVYTVKRRNDEGHVVAIDMYSNMVPGSPIIDAETGRMMGGIVGSRDEDQYFKVMYAVGDQAPYYHTPVSLFYYSPEHYEQHLFQSLSERTKLAFTNKIKQQRQQQQRRS